MWREYYVQINSIHKTVGKKYPCDLLFTARFRSAHPVDTLLSRKAMGEDLWIDVKHRIDGGRSHDSDN